MKTLAGQSGPIPPEAPRYQQVRQLLAGYIKALEDLSRRANEANLYQVGAGLRMGAAELENLGRACQGGEPIVYFPQEFVEGLTEAIRQDQMEREPR